MEIAEARGASKCVEKMEKVAPKKRRHCSTTLLNIISSLCSVGSVAFCVLLSINAADIQNRVVDLENVNGGQPFIRATGYSTDDLNSLVQQRVDELLSQRSYENFVKIRTARQTSPECNCPPAPSQLHAVQQESAVKITMHLFPLWHPPQVHNNWLNAENF